MWVSVCLDLNSTMFPESCLESVDCDKLLTIFSTLRKLAGLKGVVKPVGPEAELPAPLLPHPSLPSFTFPTHLCPLGTLNPSGLCGEVRQRTENCGSPSGCPWLLAKLDSLAQKLINGGPRSQAPEASGRLWGGQRNSLTRGDGHLTS